MYNDHNHDVDFQNYEDLVFSAEESIPNLFNAIRLAILLYRSHFALSLLCLNMPQRTPTRRLIIQFTSAEPIHILNKHVEYTWTVCTDLLCNTSKLTNGKITNYLRMTEQGKECAYWLQCAFFKHSTAIWIYFQNQFIYEKEWSDMWLNEHVQCDFKLKVSRRICSNAVIRNSKLWNRQV